MSNSIKKNSIFNMLNKAVTLLFPLLTSAYISRVLGVDGIGTVVSAQNLVTYFTMIATLGIPIYGIKAIAQSRDNAKDCNKTFTELFLINLSSTLFALIGYFIVLYLIRKTSLPTSLNFVFASLIVLNIFNVEWLYQGFEEYKYITIRSIIVKIVSFFLMLLFVKNNQDVFIYSIIICFGTVGNSLLNLTQLHKYVKFDFKELSFKRHIKFILILWASVVAVELYSLLDITMLTYMTNPSCVGYYSNATKIVKMTASMIMAIGAVLIPRLSLYFKNNDTDKAANLLQEYYNVTIMFSIPCCVGLILTGDIIIPVLFGMDFLPAVQTMKILSVLVLFMTLSGAIGGPVLISSNKQNEYFYSVFFGAIVNCILNILFIPLWRQNGAAVATVVSEFVILIIMAVFVNKTVKIKCLFNELMTIVISCVFMVVSILLYKNLFMYTKTLICLIGCVGIGTITYFITLIILKNTTMLKITNRIKNILKKRVN